MTKIIAYLVLIGIGLYGAFWLLVGIAGILSLLGVH
jgi:hypothetical protein